MKPSFEKYIPFKQINLPGQTVAKQYYNKSTDLVQC